LKPDAIAHFDKKFSRRPRRPVHNQTLRPPGLQPRKISFVLRQLLTSLSIFTVLVAASCTSIREQLQWGFVLGTWGPAGPLVGLRRHPPMSDLQSGGGFFAVQLAGRRVLAASRRSRPPL